MLYLYFFWASFNCNLTIPGKNSVAANKCSSWINFANSGYWTDVTNPWELNVFDKCLKSILLLNLQRYPLGCEGMISFSYNDLKVFSNCYLWHKKWFVIYPNIELFSILASFWTRVSFSYNSLSTSERIGAMKYLSKKNSQVSLCTFEVSEISMFTTKQIFISKVKSAMVNCLWDYWLQKYKLKLYWSK